MAAPTNTTGAIAAAKQASIEKQKKERTNTLKAYITKMQGEIEKALPSVMTPERFTRMVLSAVSATPALAECTPTSFLGAMMTAAQLGVEPNTPIGQAYLIPYKNNAKGVVECQFQLGYKGLIDLAYRSGEMQNIYAHEVYENDEFEYNFGLEPSLVHKPALKGRGEVIAYYAVFRLKNGGFGFEVMSKDDVLNHAKKFSKAFSAGPWQTNFDEMAKKTVIKKALKYAPIKTDFVKAVASDATVKNEISADMTDIAPADIEVDAETGEVISINEDGEQS